jgi:hypothetical protein
MRQLSAVLGSLAIAILFLPGIGAAQSAAMQAQQPIGDCDEACVKINSPDHPGYGCVTNGDWTGEGGCNATASYCHINKCQGIALLERDGRFRGLVTRCDGVLQTIADASSIVGTWTRKRVNPSPDHEQLKHSNGAPTSSVGLALARDTTSQS